MADTPPETPVSVTCRCGHRAVIEPRFFNKTQGCSGCERTFMVLMIQEEGAWRPKVAFGDDSAAPAPIGPWFNVTCTCGRKIGVDRRLAGRMTKCSICGQEILIALSTGPGGDDATKILHGARVSDTPLPQPRPPTEMHLLCVCGETLLITKDFFNSAIQCGSCGIRLSLHMRYDPARRRYELNANVLPD